MEVHSSHTMASGFSLTKVHVGQALGFGTGAFALGGGGGGGFGATPPFEVKDLVDRASLVALTASSTSWATRFTSDSVAAPDPTAMRLEAFLLRYLLTVCGSHTKKSYTS
jgi:hypothetical protein